MRLLPIVTGVVSVSRRRSATILKSFSAGIWSKTIPSRIASTSILSLFIAYLIGGVGRLVIDLKAENFAEDRLADIQPALCLLYIIGVGRVVHILSDLADTR